MLTTSNSNCRTKRRLPAVLPPGELWARLAKRSRRLARPCRRDSLASHRSQAGIVMVRLGTALCSMRFPMPVCSFLNSTDWLSSR